MWTGTQDTSGDLKSAPRVGFQGRRFGHDFHLQASTGPRPHNTCELDWQEITW
jgi:hypothetical protein